MNKTARIALRLLCVLTVAGAIGIVVFNQNSIAHNRTENQALLRDSQECSNLTAQQTELEQLRAVNETIKELRNNNKDLPRFRNEIRSLRQEATEAAKLRAENERLEKMRNSVDAKSVILPVGYVHRSSFADVGLSTPEATVETFLNAFVHGDIRRAKECSLDGDGGNAMSKEQEERESKQMLEQFAGFPGYVITEKKFLSENEVQINVQSAPGGLIRPLKLTLVNGEWKAAR